MFLYDSNEKWKNASAERPGFSAPFVFACLIPSRQKPSTGGIVGFWSVASCYTFLSPSNWWLTTPAKTPLIHHWDNRSNSGTWLNPTLASNTWKAVAGLLGNLDKCQGFWSVASCYRLDKPAHARDRPGLIVPWIIGKLFARRHWLLQFDSRHLLISLICCIGQRWVSLWCFQGMFSCQPWKVAFCLQ